MVLRLALNALVADIECFARWYFIDTTKRISRACLRQLGQVERIFGIRANFRHFAEPLYRDYSPGAYLFAVPWRLVLIMAGSVVAIIVIAAYLAALIFWLVLPIFVSLRLNHAGLI